MELFVCAKVQARWHNSYRHFLGEGSLLASLGSLQIDPRSTFVIESVVMRLPAQGSFMWTQVCA